MNSKSLRMICVILITSLSSLAQQGSTYIDSRDGKTYKTINVGTQTWMAENLAFKTNDECWAPDNNQNNVSNYGYLYTWEMSKKVCPSGWHLPSNFEWKILFDYLGGEKEAVIKLKSTTGWKVGNGKQGNGNNLSGFNARPAGMRKKTGSLFSFNFGEFWYFGESAIWWSSDELKYNAWAFFINNDFLPSGTNPYGEKTCGFSVRCLKN